MICAFVGIKLVEVKPGYAKANMEITDKHLNAVNIVQGGVIFTLADFAFEAASNSYGQVSLGINANISYFQPPKGKILIAEAKEISAIERGNRLLQKERNQCYTQPMYIYVRRAIVST